MKTIVLPQMIDYHRKKKELTMKELGSLMGKSESAISRWIKGERSPMVDDLDNLARIFNTSVENLMFGGTDSDILPIYNKLEQPRQKKVYTYAENELEDQEEKNKVVAIPDKKRIIQGRSTAAGAPIDGDIQDLEAETTVVDREEIPKNANEIVTIAGDSMEPFLMKGQQAFIRYTPWVENGTPAVVSIEDVGVTCKYVYVEGQDVRLVSENKDYDDMIYPCEEIRIIGEIL